MSNLAIQLAVERCDKNASEFARRIGTYPQKVHWWLRENKPLPAEFVLLAEAETGISRHDFRPDIYPRGERAA